MREMLSFLSRVAREKDSAMPGVDDLACNMVTPRFNASRHVVFLFYDKRTLQPSYVAKVPRLRRHRNAVETEAANLNSVHRLLGGGFPSVPRVVALEEHGGRLILLETALRGRALNPGHVRKNRSRCCDAVVKWLSELHRESRSEPPAGALEVRRVILSRLKKLVELSETSQEINECLERTLSLSTAITESRMPLVFEHGDLSHPNLIDLGDSQVGVIDWELADRRGLPGADLFFFLRYAANADSGATSDGDQIEAFRNAFFGPHAWTLPYVDRYVQSAGVPHEALNALFVLCWARYVSWQLIRIEEGDHPRDSKKTIRWLSGNHYYKLWRYSLDHVDQLGWGQRA